MGSTKCCRMCLNSEDLHPIFYYPEHYVKYTNIIYDTAGIKVEINDTLSHEICLHCIRFINRSINFRRKCEQVQEILENKCNIKVLSKLKIDPDLTNIDIADTLSNSDDDFKDYDDNITLDTFQINNIPTENDKASHIEKEEMKEQFIDESIAFDKKERSSVLKRVSRKIKSTDGKEKRNGDRGEVECEYCHKILTSKLSLRNHYKIHTGFDVVCEHCGKKFITRRLLLMHCRAKHGYEKTDKCSYCDYTASNAEQVKIHERLHTGEKPYVCKECNAGFHRKSSYLQHVAIHLPEKTVQCDQCPARFKSVTLMRIHKNRHRAPQYRYKCGICDNSFARRRNAARHLQRVHAMSPDHHIHRQNIN
ncbi:zinc finger protein 300-like [Leptidea sinapis]|uniref:zinc finger protein 300-like n=1 Tax=Leptidea sinapis TaxID=189913 RepID=UPI00213063F7|nr:zinc finger protein 300-like [Leptidea sinapis]